MSLAYSIRPEAPGDEQTIHDLVKRAFAGTAPVPVFVPPAPPVVSQATGSPAAGPPPAPRAPAPLPPPPPPPPTAARPIVVAPSPTVLLISSSPVSCAGACDGTATVGITGGVAPYVIVWAPPPGGGQDTPLATGLCAGVYTVTVTDVNTGCSATDDILVSSYTWTVDTFEVCGDSVHTSTFKIR